MLVVASMISRLLLVLVVLGALHDNTNRTTNRTTTTHNAIVLVYIYIYICMFIDSSW